MDFCVKFLFKVWNCSYNDKGLYYDEAKQKNMCVYGHMSNKSRVGRSALIFLLLFLIIGKTRNSRSRNTIFHFSKFLISRHLLKLFYDELRSFSTFFALNFDKKLAVE